VLHIVTMGRKAAYADQDICSPPLPPKARALASPMRIGRVDLAQSEASRESECSAHVGRHRFRAFD
jgi:hypothetical protein